MLLPFSNIPYVFSGQCHLIIVLINISLVTIDTEHFFEQLLDTGFLVCEVVYTFCVFSSWISCHYLGDFQFSSLLSRRIPCKFRCFKYVGPVCNSFCFLSWFIVSFTHLESFILILSHFFLPYFFSFLMFDFFFFETCMRIIFINPYIPKIFSYILCFIYGLSIHI